MRLMLAFASILVAVTAQAGDYGGTAKQGPRKVNANSDGKVSRDEMHNIRIKKNSWW
jgi:hypothetical protein